MSKTEQTSDNPQTGNSSLGGVTTRLFFFDCWKRDGKLETKEIEATCEEHATLKFEKELGEDYGFDPPY